MYFLTVPETGSLRSGVTGLFLLRALSLACRQHLLPVSSYSLPACLYPDRFFLGLQADWIRATLVPHFNLCQGLQIQVHSELLGVRTPAYGFGEIAQPITVTNLQKAGALASEPGLWKSPKEWECPGTLGLISPESSPPCLGSS